MIEGGRIHLNISATVCVGGGLNPAIYTEFPPSVFFFNLPTLASVEGFAIKLLLGWYVHKLVTNTLKPTTKWRSNKWMAQ